MPLEVRQIQYFHTTVVDRPGEAYRLLSQLAGESVNLIAFDLIPMGMNTSQVLLLPEDVEQLQAAAERAAIKLTGPNHAFLVQGEDQVGALIDLHRRLFDAEINVYASSGVSDGHGGFGYVLYVRAEDVRDAARVLRCRETGKSARAHAKRAGRHQLHPELV